MATDLMDLVLTEAGVCPGPEFFRLAGPFRKEHDDSQPFSRVYDRQTNSACTGSSWLPTYLPSSARRPDFQ